MKETAPQSELDQMRDRLKIVKVFDDDNRKEGGKHIFRMFVIGGVMDMQTLVDKSNLIATEMGVGLNSLAIRKGEDVDSQSYKNMMVLQVQLPDPVGK